MAPEPTTALAILRLCAWCRAWHHEPVAHPYTPRPGDPYVQICRLCLAREAARLKARPPVLGPVCECGVEAKADAGGYYWTCGHRRGLAREPANLPHALWDSHRERYVHYDKPVNLTENLEPA